MKRNPTRSLQIFFTLAAVEGLAAFVALFREPSEAGRALLLGFSPVRILLGVATLALILGAVYLALHSQRAGIGLDRWMVERGGLLFVTILAGLGFLVFLAWVLAMNAPLYQNLQDALVFLPHWTVRAVDLLRAAYQRAAPLLVWAALFCLQLLVLLIWRYPPVYRQRWQDGSFARAGLLLVMLAAVLYYWAVLMLRLKVFLVIQNWKWWFIDRDYQPPIWMYAGLILLALAGVVLVFAVFRRWPWVGVIVLIGLGYALQVGFGYLDGQGFESLRLKYAGSIFNGYAKAAAQEPPLLPALRQYEQRYGPDPYLGTKPPGVLLVYALTEKVSNAIHPAATAEARFVNLTALCAYAYPLIACLALLVLVPFGRRLAGPDGSLSRGLSPAALFYITCPSFLVVPVFLDQVLYPLLFMLGLMLTLWVIEKQDLRLAALTGAVLVVFLYFSFSLLPLVPMAVAWIGLDAWQRHMDWKHTALILLAIAGGAVVMLVLMRIGLNYDILVRYHNAFAEHRTTHVFNSFWERASNALVLNDAEFATFAGFAMITLLLVRFGRAVKNFIQGCADRMDGLLLVFLAAYFGTNIFGQTVGEVQRLFLFFVPLVALFAADEARRLFRGRVLGYALFVALQLVTAMMIFMVQPWYG